MLITKDGVIDDGKDEKTICYNKMTFSIAEFAKTDGISLKNMQNRITKFILGDIAFNEITSSDFYKKDRYTKVGNHFFTYVDLMEILDCRKATAFSRINLFRKGVITAEQVTEPVRNNGYRPASRGAKPAVNTATERAMINAIPGGGTWEEKNLNPTYFSRGSNHITNLM